jgi:hypothetical protein
MNASVIRYRTKPEAADENQRLIENVFGELAQKTPPGLSYTAFRLADSVTFVHVVDGDGVPDLTAFQEFQRTLPDRLEVTPTREEATTVGRYSA